MAAIPPWLLAAGKIVGTAAVGAGASAALASKPKIPKAPTIDTAAQNQQETDRIARRRGVLANIFAGGGTGGAAPSVGKATLGGA